MTLKLHHLNASRSQRIVWLLQELQVEHEIVHHTRDAVTNLAPPELLTIHPMGKSPLLEDGGVVVAETGAIAEYLMEKFDPEFRLHPRHQSEDYPRYLEWVHAAEGAVFLPGLITFYLMRAGHEDSPLLPMMTAEREKALDYMEAHLSTFPYFAGHQFTAADCLMGFMMETTHAAGGLDTRPSAKAWLERMRARPAYQKMLDVGI